MADDKAAIDAEFMSIANNFAAERPNELLDKWIAESRRWLATRRAAGEVADLRTLTSQVLHERPPPAATAAILCAAIMRLIEIEDGK